jgi:predicted kinase
MDDSFLLRSQRTRFRTLAAAAGVPFLLLECHAAAGELRRRVAQREMAGNDASEATLAVLEHQLATVEPLAADERDSALSIDTQRDDSQNIVEQVCLRLRLPPRAKPR